MAGQFLYPETRAAFAGVGAVTGDHMNLRGCGTALVTPFQSDGSVDEAALRVARRLAGRIRDRFPRPLRHHRRDADAHAGRMAARHRDHHRSRRPAACRSSPGPPRTLRADAVEKAQHRRRRQRRGRHPHRLALLQQAHAGRPVPAFQGHRRSRRASRWCSTTSPDAPAPTSSRPRLARLAQHPQHHRHQGSQRQHQPDGRPAQRCARHASSCSRETMRSRCR